MTSPGPGDSLTDLVRAARLPAPSERKRIRKAARLTLRQIGDELGVTEAAVWHWENGTKGQGPSLENAARYRELLDKLAKAVS